MNVVYIQDQEIYEYQGHYYHPKSTNFFVRFLEGLDEEDRLFVYAGLKKVKDESRISKYQKVDHPQIEYRSIPDFRKLENVFSIALLMGKIVKNADFCYLRCGLAASIASFSCVRKRIPYMAIVNEDIFKNTITHSKLIVRLSAYPLSALNHYMTRHANYACYVTKDYLQKRYPCKGEMLGCSDIEYLDINDKYLAERAIKLKEPKRKTILGSVGAVSTVIKGQDTVIKALAYLKNKGHSAYEYQLVGTGDQSYLRSLAEKIGVLDQVVFKGEYKHEDVLKWFETIDVYLHPSRSEGLPRTILEAMTKATPCICSNVGGIPELINSRFLFAYDGSEVETLSQMILDMTTEVMEKESMSNYLHSKEYDPVILASLRSNFFIKALSESKKN